jgi:AcrR family transcriptional regulator
MMIEKINLKENILESAKPQFIEKGFYGTSMRQIAKSVGCTKAALYYHFKKGKDEIFSELMKANRPDFSRVMDGCQNPESLQEVIQYWANALLSQQTQVKIPIFRMVMQEFDNISLEERDKVQNAQVICLQKLADRIEPFAVSPAQAMHMAVLLFSATIGYGMVFRGMGLDAKIDISMEEYLENLSELIHIDQSKTED